MLTYRSTAEEIANSGVDTAVLPVGSIEQHGAHLPIGTDYLIAGEVAAAVSEQLGGLLLPALPISTCREHKGGAGSVWMNAGTFLQMLKDISESLRVQKFRRLALVIGHGGVFIAGPAVREINSDNPDFKVIRADLANFMLGDEMNRILDSRNNLHACECETSLMLYLNEGLVRKDRIADCVPQVPRDYLNYGSILKYSGSGVWGNPSLATREKGERIFQLLVEKSVAYILEVNRLFGE